MLIIKLTETRETLDDIEKICLYLTEHKELLALMTTEEVDDISYILRPTFKADHNQNKKEEHWQKLFDEFTLTDDKGDEMHFYREEVTEALYFGNEKGFETLKSIDNDGPTLKNTFHNLD
ncbi:MAG: hypothetical protein ACTHYX_07900 [Psychrobacter sp.]